MKLETMTSAHFSTLLERSCWVETGNGTLELTVAKVREAPHAGLPKATRTPFSVLLRGPESPALLEGSCALRVDGADGWRLEGVYISRVMPPVYLAPGAYYQLVFN
jgi:hypothetical protein